MPGISIHVVDVARGVPASGLRVELVRLDVSELMIAAGRIDARGLLADAALDTRFAAGVFEARFHVAEFYRRAGVTLPAVPFIEVAPYRFGIADPEQHYHLPFKMTPWGYSCFRGGA